MTLERQTEVVNRRLSLLVDSTVDTLWA